MTLHCCKPVFITLIHFLLLLNREPFHPHHQYLKVFTMLLPTHTHTDSNSHLNSNDHAKQNVLVKAINWLIYHMFVHYVCSL